MPFNASRTLLATPNGSPAMTAPAQKHLRIGGEHRRGHGAAGGQAGDEDAASADVMIGGHFFDHLPDRAGLALVARDVFRVEPVEAGVGVVGRLLLRHQERKAVTLRQRRPAGAEIIAGGALAAAVQYHDQRGPARQVRRHVRKHLQAARIGAESRDFDQRAAQAVSLVAPVISEAVEMTQLRKTAQEFDILSKGHRQLLGTERIPTSADIDSCCSAR